MSQTLTENVVLVRTRSHDLNSVRKLNCWGCTLKDVSIVNRMPNVEVISLSINSIDTLKYFSSCTMLQELYLRKNEIKDINEILHLSQLQFLKKLSLEDNPCANVENYRLTVLKALPNLEYLDNIKVTAEEIYQAEKLGRELIWPGTETECCYGDDDHQGTVPVTSAINESSSSSSLVVVDDCPYEPPSPIMVTNETTTATTKSLSATAAEFQPYTASPATNGMELPAAVSSTATFSRTNNNSSNFGQYSKEAPPIPQPPPSSSSSTTGHHGKRTTNMAKANSLSDYNIYGTNGNNFRCSSPALSGSTNTYDGNDTFYDNGNNNGGMIPGQIGGHGAYNQAITGNFRSNSGSNRGSNISSANTSNNSQQQRILPKGGKNRNANILSAVLCLIKELDYGSLEVVDTTIHCRMEEMED